jgi:hypothetical protein
MYTSRSYPGKTRLTRVQPNQGNARESVGSRFVPASRPETKQTAVRKRRDPRIEVGANHEQRMTASHARPRSTKPPGPVTVAVPRKTTAQASGFKGGAGISLIG